MAIIKKLTELEDIEEFMCSDEDMEDTIICKNPDKVKALVKAMTPGRIIHFVSKGDWSMHDLIVELLNNYYPAELFFTTYALRDLSVKQLINALSKKKLTGIHLLIDFKAKSSTPEVELLTRMNVNRICLTSIHAKVAVLRTANHYISINSSANWTINPRIESGTISMSEKVGKFHIEWMEKRFNNAEIFE